MTIPPCRLPDGDEHSHIKDLETQRCRRVHTPGHFPDPAARRILRHRPRDMSSFTVHTPALAAAALTISANAGSVSDATTAALSASAAAGAFGGEPIGAAFLDMCSRAQTATQALQTTMESLSH